MRSVKSPSRIIWVAMFLAVGLFVAPSLERAAQAAATTERAVSMMDGCESESFNAAFGPGTCLRNGGVSLDEFIFQLTKHQSVGAWHYAGSASSARVGDTFVATNRGGEVHTFTEVDDFGGGVIQPLNDLSGNPVPRFECLALEDDDFVAPGQKYRETLDSAGTKKFQCCIHPWMRLEAKVQ